MFVNCILVVLFALYGTISVFNLVKTYSNYGFIIKDSQCENVYYCNYVNSGLGVLLSIFVVSFLLVKFLCMRVMDCKVSFSLTKLLIFFAFIGINLWNGIELIHNNECYLKYKIRNYNLAYIGLISAILLTIICSILFSKNAQSHNKERPYTKIEE
jgi:hypothetical protein